jgi:hypothetical protein
MTLLLNSLMSLLRTNARSTWINCHYFSSKKMLFTFLVFFEMYTNRNRNIAVTLSLTSMIDKITPW